ncbi:hypothetical protein BUALT_Bualt11G0031300 [Buddleja alternifolia]|uniref:Uncharacterized protein n=1 Tax=Buddleja alternifolia TaxID=168488 RepID=A0AAV6WSF4_9LAMI|nr:hypothetical protein BUALT_Bualt11G0031300 [Buddleja alternifolia]
MNTIDYNSTIQLIQSSVKDILVKLENFLDTHQKFDRVLQQTVTTNHQFAVNHHEALRPTMNDLPISVARMNKLQKQPGHLPKPMGAAPHSNLDVAFYICKMPRIIRKIQCGGNDIKTNVVNTVDIAKALRKSASYTTKYFDCKPSAQLKFDEKIETAHLAEFLENFKIRTSSAPSSPFARPPDFDLKSPKLRLLLSLRFGIRIGRRRPPGDKNPTPAKEFDLSCAVNNQIRRRDLSFAPSSMAEWS